MGRAMDTGKLEALQSLLDRSSYHMPGDYLLVQQMPSEANLSGGYERVRIASGTHDEVLAIRDRETFGQRNLDYEVLPNEGADNLPRWKPRQLPGQDASYPLTYMVFPGEEIKK